MRTIDDADRLIAAGDRAGAAGDWEKAIAVWREADAARPGDARLLMRIGDAHRRLMHGPEARSALMLAETSEPDNPWPKIRLAELYCASGHLALAARKIDEALALDPDIAFAALVGAKIELMTGAEADAVRRLADARRRHPKNGRVAYHLGSILIDLGLPKHGLDHLAAARSLGAAGVSDLDLDMIEGVGRLASGELDRGWALFHRKIDNAAQSAALDMPGVPAWWRPGDPSPQGRVLLVPNEGVGDDVLFGHLIGAFRDKVRRAGGHLTLAATPRLAGLFRRSFPGLAVVETRDAKEGGVTRRRLAAPLDGVDIGVGYLALPLLTDPRVAPATGPGYLKPDPARVAAFKAGLAASGPAGAPLIGVTWTSSLAKGERARHFPRLNALQELRALAPARLVNLQYGDVADDLGRMRAAGLTVETVAQLDLREDLDGLAALASALDAVIGVANASSAIAAAVGAPVYLQCRESHWSLLGQGPIYPWTPHVRITTFDEAGHPGAWAKAAARLKRDILD